MVKFSISYIGISPTQKGVKLSDVVLLSYMQLSCQTLFTLNKNDNICYRILKYSLFYQ